MEDPEIWKDIPDFDAYQVSSYGNIRGVALQGRLAGGKRPQPRESKIGRAEVTLNYYDGRGGSSKVKLELSKLVAEAFIGLPSGNFIIRHLDGDTMNCRLDNLDIVEW